MATEMEKNWKASNEMKAQLEAEHFGRAAPEAYGTLLDTGAQTSMISQQVVGCRISTPVNSKPVKR